MMKKYGSLVLWILVFEAMSYAIGMATQSHVDNWYRTLTPPPLTPPNLLFPIMWTTLYALIAATGWTLWTRRAQTPDGKRLLALFAVYMALNWSWSFIFFSAHQLFIGLAWIIVMNVIALVLIAKTWKGMRSTALLMIPPTLWTCFAAYLNSGYWWLNH